MPRPTDAAPAPEWSESEYLIQNDFETLAARRVILKLELEQIETEIRDLSLEMGAMLATADLSSVKFGNFRITLAHSMKGGKLSRERLIELGVPVKTLEAATTPREPGTSFLTVTETKPPVTED